MQRDKYFGISKRIHSWKLDNLFEHWLSELADNSNFWKKVYVCYYKIFDNEYYRKGLPFINKQLDTFANDWKGLNRNDVTRDMIYCLHRWGISFQDYWIYQFVDKSLFARHSFVSDKLRYHYCDLLNHPDILPLMSDKYACYLKYKIFYKREVLGCFQTTDYDNFLSFCKIHPDFVFKPLTGHSGQGIQILSADKLPLKEFFEQNIQKEKAFIIEERIIQGDETAKVHPESINSLRVLTFVLNEQVHIIGITWRIGVGKSVMDNAGAGGIYASVDPEHGIVQTDAINYQGKHYLHHPDTGIQIIGFQLPKWDEAKALIKAMALHIKGTTLIAWDIAYSNKGWLMLEANENGDWSIIQSNKKEGKKAELYSYMDEFFK